MIVRRCMLTIVTLSAILNSLKINRFMMPLVLSEIYIYYIFLISGLPFKVPIEHDARLLA